MEHAVAQPQRAARHLGDHDGVAIRDAKSPSLARRLAGEKKGSVAIIFAITSFVVVAMVGGAVDLGRAYSVKAKMQAVTDAASLASASRYMNDEDHNATKAIQQGISYFNASMSDEPSATMSSALDEGSKTVTSQGNLAIRTPFLAILGIESITVTSYSVVSAAESATGGGDSELEMSLMLDVTGSMGASDGAGKTKLKAMQDAAKSLIDVLIPSKGEPKAKIALAPFAAYVRLPEATLMSATGEPLVKEITSTYKCNEKTTCTPGACKEYHTSGKKKGECKKYEDDVCTTTFDMCSSKSTQYQSRCIGERRGDQAFMDAAPAAGSYILPIWKSSSASANDCTPGESIVPLTSSASKLKNTIDEFSAGGSTAGHLGTAWAWYMLSPEWSGVFTGASAPKAYGAPKLKKIAVLMTDGEYNTFHAKDADGNAIQGDSPDQARALCSGMKAKGIEVYTVGFKLDNDAAKATLRDCATDADHAFLAEDGLQLTAAFKEIAFRSVPIHIAR